MSQGPYCKSSRLKPQLSRSSAARGLFHTQSYSICWALRAVSCSQGEFQTPCLPVRPTRSADPASASPLHSALAVSFLILQHTSHSHLRASALALLLTWSSLHSLNSHATTSRRLSLTASSHSSPTPKHLVAPILRLSPPKRLT